MPLLYLARLEAILFLTARPPIHKHPQAYVDKHGNAKKRCVRYITLTNENPRGTSEANTPQKPCRCTSYSMLRQTGQVREIFGLFHPLSLQGEAESITVVNQRNTKNIQRSVCRAQEGQRKYKPGQVSSGKPLPPLPRFPTCRHASSFSRQTLLSFLHQSRKTRPP